MGEYNLQRCTKTPKANTLKSFLNLYHAHPWIRGKGKSIASGLTKFKGTTGIEYNNIILCSIKHVYI